MIIQQQLGLESFPAGQLGADEPAENHVFDVLLQGWDLVKLLVTLGAVIASDRVLRLRSAMGNVKV